MTSVTRSTTCPKKLLQLPERLHSQTARRLAEPRVRMVRAFYEAMLAELVD